MENKKKTEKINIPLYAAAIILVLLIFTVYFMPRGLYASYKTRENAEDTANVADFRVSSTLEGTDDYFFTINRMTPGDEESYTLRIENDSEVAVKCTVVVTNVTGNIPLSFIITNDDTSAEGVGSFEESYPANDSSVHTYTVKVKWDNTSSSDNFDSQGSVDKIVVSVRCEQID